MASKDFGTQSTHIKGVKIRTEGKKKVDIEKGNLDFLYNRSERYVRTDRQIKGRSESKDNLKGEIVSVAEMHDGLRGIISQEDNFKLNITPVEKTEYDDAKLRESLGKVTYSTIAKEELNIQINVPIDLVSEQKDMEDFSGTVAGLIVETIKNALVAVGVPEEEMDAIMSHEVEVDLDKDELEDMVEEGKVELASGAKTTEISYWRLAPDKLK